MQVDARAAGGPRRPGNGSNGASMSMAVTGGVAIGVYALVLCFPPRRREPQLTDTAPDACL